jgi:ElaB/YqjD/DUF883 family membrane-anchored ribosome-binding protein
MENEEVIRKQMEETRTSLTEKLETLEDKVANTVCNATEAVNDTVSNVKETVQETVSAVKESVQDSVCSVKETIQEGVSTVKDWFDLPAHIEAHPWIMMAGCVGVGYVLGRFLGAEAQAGEAATALATEAAPAPAPVITAAAARAAAAAPGKAGPALGHGPRHHHNGGHHDGRERRPKAPSGVLAQLRPEFDKLKALALSTMLGTVREMVVPAVPEHIGQQLGEVIDNATRKLGGEPIPASDWANWSSTHSCTEGESHASDQQRFPPEMGRPMGPTRRQG